MNEANENWVEMAMLCNMMVSAEVCELALEQLHEDYFTDSRNRILFRTIKQLSVQPERRFEMLMQKLRNEGLEEAAGGKAYVFCVYLFVPAGDTGAFMRLLIPKAA